MIAILDVCSGNLRSVERALAHVGADVVVTHDPEVVARADKLVVPGQGAFGPFMRGITERRLEAPLRAAIAKGTPYLGICLGLQVLFEHSEEGDVAGLGVLRGRVTKLAPTDKTLKIPHMGWNQVAQKLPVPGLATDAYVYFVHSYRVEPADPSVVALEATHGVTFCAGVRRDNVLAVQFHPEKSQGVGLALLRAFVEAA
ncbi:MAG: imidazole glycerol phosphate synthase subunit HisH [Deltaproteobacteria bacterium]|nr:imidazole glycerol phosphate synthase subunit HisH [Deltaproteobacteria bacterium]